MFSMDPAICMTILYCTGTLTRNSWIRYTDCWIVK